MLAFVGRTFTGQRFPLPESGALALGKAVPNWTARFLVTLASGLIVGDALVGAASAVATVLQGLWAT